MRRRRRSKIWPALLVGLVLALLGWQYLRYRASLETLPAGMTVAGMDVEGMTPEEAVENLRTALSQPVQLVYQGQTLALRPESVAFRFDPEGTLDAIQEAVAWRRTLDGFLAFLLRREPEPVAVEPVATFSQDRLDGFLNEVARQYDHPPQPPVPLPETLTFRDGLPGYKLDHEASRERVAAALLSAANRRAELVVRTEDAPALGMAQLQEMLEALLADFDGLPSIFVKDLQTGEEMEINPDVAYAGMSILKIAVMVETYRALDRPPNLEETKLLTETMTLSGNFTANLLLRDVIDEGDAYRGVETLTLSMRYLGLVNTFMATPYDEEVVPPTIVTPANSRTDVTSRPDPYMQTTARDMGLLLEMIYQCSKGGGTLMVAYPGAFTPEECQQMLDIMSQNRIGGLFEDGLPEGTRLAHKHGWISNTELTDFTIGDAGIVFSPSGDFVLVAFLSSPNWIEWDYANPLMANIATATYNYFNR
ncbi:MAG TPA: hypothetical protein ENK08_02220 [Chloroflexi bacterium]|nr:hypothetical protein [Chloroflexota bacterium]